MLLNFQPLLNFHNFYKFWSFDNLVQLFGDVFRLEMCAPNLVSNTKNDEWWKIKYKKNM